MSTDYIVASLPSLAFGAPAPLTGERFAEIAGSAANAALNRIFEQIGDGKKS